MRAAKLQNQDLIKTEQFVSSLLSGENVKDLEKSAAPEPPKTTQMNGSLSFKMDGKPRFTDPPAPPPQQPLPEKPDVARSHPPDQLSPLLKRTNTERPRSVPSVSPIRPSPDPQMSNLMEALQQAKKEIDAQSSRVKTLEDELLRERQARESAEDLAKRLEMESHARMNGFAKSEDRSIIDEAFEPPSEQIEEDTTVKVEEVTAIEAEAATARLQQKLDAMLIEMREMKQHMEAYRQRAETAEMERDEGRKTLAEMVSKIRADEEARRSRSHERSELVSPSEKAVDSSPVEAARAIVTDTKKALASNVNFEAAQGQLAAALRPPGSQDQLLYHTTPYASMLGVVLLGMGFMAYMNGWQKVER